MTVPNYSKESVPLFGSCPILVMSRTAWRIVHISTRETHTVNREYAAMRHVSTAFVDDGGAAPHPLPRCARAILTVTDAPTAFAWTACYAAST